MHCTKAWIQSPSKYLANPLTVEAVPQNTSPCSLKTAYMYDLSQVQFSMLNTSGSITMPAVFDAQGENLEQDTFHK